MNNKVELDNRVPNLLLSHSNKSKVLPIITGPPSVVTENISLISISLSSKFLVKSQVLYIFSFSSAIHRFQATKLFMYFAVTAVSSYNC